MASLSANSIGHHQLTGRRQARGDQPRAAECRALPSASLDRAPILSQSVKSAVRVHQLAIPLAGLEFLEGLAIQLSRPLPRQAAVHRAVCVSWAESHTLYDFLPLQPTAPRTALALLAGQSVEGMTRERSLSRLPTSNCAYVGETQVSQDQALQKARLFCKSYDLQLALGRNDCRRFCKELVQHLLGTSMHLDYMQWP